MKVIKDSKSKKEVNSYLTGDGGDIVTMMEKEWPEMTASFVVAQENNMNCSYINNMITGSNISVGTQLQTEEEIQLSLTGLWFRMNDKIQRLKTMLMTKRESVVDEPMEDAYLDVSNYGIIKL